jgi:hypothetical protein
MPATEERLWVSCPRCSRRARSGQPFCELCGWKYGGEASGPEARERLSCDNCGAAVTVAAGERTAACAFCGTPYVRAGELSSLRHPPEFVLPFSVSRSEAEMAYRSWLGRRGWLSPGDFQAAGLLEGLRGVYIPFWSFTMRSESAWKARVGEYWWQTVTEHYTVREGGRTVTRTRTRRVRHTEWYPLEGRYHQFHSGYLISASKGLPQETADALLPFPLAEASRYAPHFLAGWLCEEYTVSKEDAVPLAEAEYIRREEASVRTFLPGDCHDDVVVSTHFQDRSEDLVLLPFWVFAHAYRGKIWRFVVNGVSGKVQGRKPVSPARFACVIIAAVLGLGALAALLVFAARGF